jgi:CubicO group peptidase (beta-lactamase class C family)
MNGGIVGDPGKVGVDKAGLEGAIKLLEEQKTKDLINGAQLFAARKGQVVVDAAIGDAVPGVPMRTDSVLFWASATKPLTAM